MNPFDKYLSKEDVLLANVGNYIKLQYPKVLFFHPYNEGRRTKFEQYKTKKLHMLSGIPDILIFEQSWDGDVEAMYFGLAIELKIGKNVPTKNQLEVMQKLEDSGWKTSVCYSFDEAKDTIDNYLK